MSRNETLKAIYKHITLDFKYSEDEELLKFGTVYGIGYYLYSEINSNIAGSLDEYIKSVAGLLLNSELDIQSQSDFYEVIYQSSGFYELPKKVYIKVLREFINLHKYYGEVCLIIKNKIENINRELQINFEDQRKLINNCNSTVSFVKDLKHYENKLLEMFSKCNNLKTEKEMLKFSREYMSECMGKFSNIERRDLILPHLRELAIKLSREEEYNIKMQFQYYYDIISITEFNIENYYNIFFKVKLYKIKDDIDREMNLLSLKSIDSNEMVEFYKSKIDGLPKIKDLISKKLYRNIDYNSELKNIVDDYDLIKDLKDRIKNSFCLYGRKEVLIKALELFENKEYEIFNNIIPIQLEGMFSDYLKDTTTLSRFTDLNLYQNTVLREKIKYLKAFNSGIYAEAILYFGFHFNNRIRNLIAHGNYNKLCNDYEKHEVFSLELILDLNFMVHMLSRRSETERMHRFVNNYKTYFKSSSSIKDAHFQALFNDLNGQRLHYEYDSLAYPRPMQVIYWLLNPYYEDIYEKTTDKSQLLELREDVLSEEFWSYVDKLLEEDIKSNLKYLKIHHEFKSIVKGLFLCDISFKTKEILKKVNKRLQNM